jgi:hypothetical protein
MLPSRGAAKVKHFSFLASLHLTLLNKATTLIAVTHIAVQAAIIFYFCQAN